MRINSLSDKFPAANNEQPEKSGSPKAQRLSDADIRAKLEAHKASKQSIQNKKASVPKTRLPKASEVENMDLKEPPTVSLLNDPKAPETQGKLREILRSGAFSFSDKERSVLGKILEE